MSFSPRLTLTRKHSSLGYRHRYATANFTKLSVNKESYRPRSLFTSQSRRFYRNKKIISQFLVSKERRTLENPGSVRRKEI